MGVSTKIFRRLISGVVATTLAFAGVAVVSTEAQAVSVSGCNNNNGFSAAQKLKCYIDSSAPVTSLTAVSVNVGTSVSTDSLDYQSGATTTVSSACVAPTYALYLSPVSDTSTAITAPIVGMTFSTAHGTLSGATTGAMAATDYNIAASCTDGSIEIFSLRVTVNQPNLKTLPPITTTVGTHISTDALDFQPDYLNASNVLTSSDTSDTVDDLCTSPNTYEIYRQSNQSAGNSYDSVDGLDFSATYGTLSGDARDVMAATNFVIVASCGGTPQKFSLTITVSAAPVVNPPSTGGGNSNPAPEKVTICHRTHATTNPYVRITVSIASVMNKAGHESHDEIYLVNHVYNAAIKYPAKDKKWGDIIPADPSGQNRWKPLNWTTLGAAIWNGSTAGCPTMTTQQYYNALRESGVPEKNIKKEVDTLEEEQGKTKTDPASLKYTGPSTKVLEEENDKVTICHATNSVTNPYRKITVSSSSVTNKAGHMSHDDIYLDHHVFDASVNYPANKKDWGDIIPADPTGKNRWAPLNWTDLGQKIYSGAVAGCAEETTQEVYNKLRESGATKKEILEELRKDGNIDDDPADIEDLKYDGKDPEVEKTEPKPPVEPTNVKIPDQSLSGIVWLDLNRDGFKDPEEPLMKGIKLSVVQVTSVSPGFARSGVRSSLRTAAVSSDIKFKAAAVVTVTTDANGFYLFPSLGAGDWQVVTEVPTELSVTYDSQGSNEGEIIATVPVASHAFTYVGLISDDETVNNKLVEENTPKPATVDPTKTPATGTKTPTKTPTKTGVKTSAAGTRGSVNQLAYTGDTPSSLPMGVAAFMVIIGLGFIALGRRKSTN